MWEILYVVIYFFMLAESKIFKNTKKMDDSEWKLYVAEEERLISEKSELSVKT